MWQKKKALSDCSKLQRCVRAVHRAGGSSREQPRGRVHWTEQRILEVTARRSPRGLATDHLQPAGRSLLYPGAAQSPLGSSGVHPGGFGDAAVPGCPQEERRTRAAAGREQQQQELTPGTKQLPEGQRGQNQLTSSCAALLYAAKPVTAAQAARAHILPSPLPERLHLRLGLPGRSRRGRRKAGLQLQPGGEGKSAPGKGSVSSEGFGCLGKYPSLFRWKLTLA